MVNISKICTVMKGKIGNNSVLVYYEETCQTILY